MSKYRQRQLHWDETKKNYSLATPVRAPAALEADLRSQNIDICVVCETHLSTETPEAIVSISDYAIFRRGRAGKILIAGKRVVWPSM